MSGNVGAGTFDPEVLHQDSAPSQRPLAASPRLDQSRELEGLAKFMDELGEFRLSVWVRYQAVYYGLREGRTGAALDPLVLGLADDLDMLDPQRLVSWSLQASNLPITPEARSELTLLSARGLARSERWSEADLVLGLTPQPLLQDSLQPAWYGIRASVSLHRLDWENAATSYEQLAVLCGDPRLRALAERVRAGTSLSYRSPRLAGFLALVPGLGYAYTGHVQTAIAALLVNGLTGFAAREAIRDREVSLSVSVGLLAFGWYSGSIYGSVLSARRHNEYVRESFIGGFPDYLGPGPLTTIPSFD